MVARSLYRVLNDYLLAQHSPLALRSRLESVSPCLPLSATLSQRYTVILEVREGMFIRGPSHIHA